MICAGRAATRVVAHPAGILQGIDQQWTGRVERVDNALLRSLLDNDIIPVIPPLGCDGEGSTYRLNSDAVAVEVAKSLGAVKLIYLTNNAGVLLRKAGASRESYSPIDRRRGRCGRQKTTSRIKSRQRFEVVAPSKRGKGVCRASISSTARSKRAFWAKSFPTKASGHSSTPTNIKRFGLPGRKTHGPSIRSSVAAWRARNFASLRCRDRTPNHRLLSSSKSTAAWQACVSFHVYPNENKGEMACVCVAGKFENQGIGLRLMNFVEELARQRSVKKSFACRRRPLTILRRKAAFVWEIRTICRSSAACDTIKAGGARRC